MEFVDLLFKQQRFHMAFRYDRARTTILFRPSIAISSGKETTTYIIVEYQRNRRFRMVHGPPRSPRTPIVPVRTYIYNKTL